MKKSLKEATARAQRLSAEHPNNTVRVMDKPRNRAVVCASEWIYKERVLDGYVTVAVFKDGKDARL